MTVFPGALAGELQMNNNSKLRRRIAAEAARLLMQHEETHLGRARVRAARRIGGGPIHPADWPTHAEIREELETLAREGGGQTPTVERLLVDNRNRIDRFQVYATLLAPLEHVQQNPKYHPEGDALYHSLQVFDLARDELPYDEEFLLAALLHDVGKAIDPIDPVAAGLEALEGFVTDRTAWLIANQDLGNSVLDRTIGQRAKRRLEEDESYEELILLCRCDRAGRQAGVPAAELDEALDYLRDLDDSCSGGD